MFDGLYLTIERLRMGENPFPLFRKKKDVSEGGVS